MASSDRISGIICLIFSLLAAIESYRLGIGTPNSPQSGLFPLAVSIALAVLSAALFLSTIKRKPNLNKKIESITFNRQALPKTILVVLSLFFYALFLEALGFILTTIIQTGFLLGTIGTLKKHIVIILAISIAVVAYVTFDVFLSVQLPKGFLGF